MAACDNFSDNEEILGVKRYRSEEVATTFFASSSAAASDFNFQFPPSPKTREVTDDSIIEDRPPSPYSITATFEDLFSLPKSTTPSASSTRLQFGERGGSGEFPPFEAFTLSQEMPFGSTRMAVPPISVPHPIVADQVSVPSIISALQNLPQNRITHTSQNNQQQLQLQQQHQQQQQQQRTAKASRPAVNRHEQPVPQTVPAVVMNTLNSTAVPSSNVSQAPLVRGSSDISYLSRSDPVQSSLQPMMMMSLMTSAASFEGVPANVSAALRELSGNSEYVVLPSLLSSQFQRRKTHKISLEQVKSTCRMRAQTGDAFVGIYSLQERKDRMDLWAVSRSKRTFKKNIKYAHRHDLAGGRQRVGGRFVKSKGNEDITPIPGENVEVEEEHEEGVVDDILIEVQGV